MRQGCREMEAAAGRGLLNGDDQFKYFPVVVVGVRVRLTQENWQSEQQQRQQQQPEPRLPAFSS